MKDFIFKTGTASLHLNGITGAVEKLKFRGRQMLMPSSELFVLHFRDDQRNLFTIKSSEFSKLEFNGEQLLMSGNSKLSTLQITIKIRVKDDFFFLTPALTGIPTGIAADHWDFLPLTVENNGRLLYPFSEGVLVDNPAQFEFNQLSFPDRFYWWGVYPGICQMQFMAHCRPDNTGLYFAAYDPYHGTKNIAFGNDGSGNVGMHIEMFCGTEDLSCYTPDLEYVIGAFDGNWYDAAGIYREWLWSVSPELHEPSVLPDWLDDSPVIVTAPVRGDGTIKPEPNEYLPYENLMPHIRKLAEAFDCRVMSHLMRWDQHSPWAPPYIWPPAGGAESMIQYGKMLHAENHLLGLYGSGTSFTVKSFCNDYSIEDEYRANNYEQFMTCGPHGETEADICHGIRDGRGMCITEQWVKDIFKEQVMMMADAGADFIQLLDQNLGGCSLLCYSREHAHPEIPGQWQTEAMNAFLDELNKDISSAGHNTLIGTECASAEPYVSRLRFNDLRAVFAYHYGMPVPLHQFVFHQYSVDFMGNQAGVTQDIDCVNCPENILWRIAYAFNAGNLLSVTLRDKGVIDWGAAADWNSPPPNQENVCVLIRNLNKMRLKHPQYLRHGKMLKPRLDISGENYALKMVKRNDEIIDSFTRSCWYSPQGKTAEFITNFMPYEQTFSCRVPKGVRIICRGDVFKEEFQLKIAPLDAEFIEIITEK